MRLPESGRGAPCGRPSQGITPRTVQIVVRYRKFSTSLATGGRFLGRKKKVGAPLVGALPPLWAPFVGYFGVRIKMRLPCRINNVVCLSSNRCGIVLRAPCPRSSVDRASASGAGSTGSNPVGGTKLDKIENFRIEVPIGTQMLEVLTAFQAVAHPPQSDLGMFPDG